jgi:hypothetical protein
MHTGKGPRPCCSTRPPTLPSNAAKGPAHLVRTSNTSTVWWEASARPLSLMMIGASMPRWMQTSCTHSGQSRGGGMPAASLKYGWVGGHGLAAAHKWGSRLSFPS